MPKRNSPTKSPRKWMPKSFSVNKTDMPAFRRLARQAKSMKPPVSESAFLVQILKDYFFVHDEIEKASLNGKKFRASKQLLNGEQSS